LFSVDVKLDFYSKGSNIGRSDWQGVLHGTFYSGNLKGINHLGDIILEGNTRVVLGKKKKTECGVWTGSIWLRMGFSGGIL
jgi:hypothetical protein